MARPRNGRSSAVCGGGFAWTAVAALAMFAVPQTVRAAGTAAASDRDPTPPAAADDDSGNSLRALTPTPAPPAKQPSKSSSPAPSAHASDPPATPSASDSDAGDSPSTSASDADPIPAGKIPPAPDSDDSKPLIDSPNSRSVAKLPNEVPAGSGIGSGGGDSSSGEGGGSVSANGGFKTAERLPADPPLKIEPAHFKSMQPGTSTMEELVRRWGQGVPSRSKDGTVSWVYKFDPYPRIVVSLAGKHVSAIDVQLDKPWDAEARWPSG